MRSAPTFMELSELIDDLKNSRGKTATYKAILALTDQYFETERLRNAGAELEGALSRIDYLLGPANDQECSLYDIDRNEDRVVERVKSLVADRDRLVRMLVKVVRIAYEASDSLRSQGVHSPNEDDCAVCIEVKTLRSQLDEVMEQERRDE